MEWSSNGAILESYAKSALRRSCSEFLWNEIGGGTKSGPRTHWLMGSQAETTCSCGMERNKLSNLCGPGHRRRRHLVREWPPIHLYTDPMRCQIQCTKLNADCRRTQAPIAIAFADADGDGDDDRGSNAGQVTFYWRLRARRPRFCYLEAWKQRRVLTWIIDNS